jgi:hypothetical protein
MPQSAVRGSPVVEIRQGADAINKAALSIEPAGTEIGDPFT